MDEPALEVACQAAAGGWSCLVNVGDDAGQTRHEVAVAPGDIERYAAGAVDAVALVRVSFGFLLEREPRESIMRRFALPVIESYFPEYRALIRRRLPGDG